MTNYNKNLNEAEQKRYNKIIDFYPTSKSEQKLFQKVLTFYPSLKPRYYKFVINKINEIKLSDKSKEKMLMFNEKIYNNMFNSGEFLKTIDNFQIGDLIYIDPNKEAYIEELTEINNEYYIIPSDYNPNLDHPIPLYLISHKKRNENPDKSIFTINKEKTITDMITKDVITSQVQFLIKFIAENQLDLNPIYQRDYVWSTEQKQSFITSLVQGKTAIKPTYLYNNTPINEPMYEVLDGKQRINAVLSYMKNEFSVNDFYYRDLSIKDTNKFLHLPVEYTRIKYYHPQKGHTTMPLEYKIELFLQINEYGQKMNDTDLEKAKQYVKKNNN